MLRKILGIVIGIVAAWAVSFVLYTIIWTVLGADGSFEAGTFDISMTWIGLGLVVSVLAGAGGGLLAGVIGRWRKLPVVFTILVALLGVPGIIAAFATAGDPPTPRVGDVTMFDAMGKTRQPVWSALVTTGVFVASAFAGAQVVSRRKA